MKITLAFLLCSYVAETCLPPHIHPMQFDNEYEYCLESVNDCGSSEWNCDTGSLSIGNVGDVNLDGLIDILDIIIILNFVLEYEIPNQNELWLSDINSDGSINILDIVFLVNVVLSIPNN